MISRREFCVGALAFGAAAAGGCRERAAVLKIPENADECADLFRFFTDPSLEYERAKTALGITGDPRVMEDPRFRKVYSFDDQGDVVKSIGFETGGRDRPDAGRLKSIYIYYSKPINLSLSRLESHLGASEVRSTKVAAQLEPPIAMVTNLQPGQKERERSTYSFYPENPIAPGHLKGNLIFQCDAATSDTKRVDVLWYQRQVD